jgi:hypothetical protein
MPYYLIGNLTCLSYSDFVMPDEDHGLKALAGYELGKAC